MGLEDVNLVDLKNKQSEECLNRFLEINNENCEYCSCYTKCCELFKEHNINLCRYIKEVLKEQFGVNVMYKSKMYKYETQPLRPMNDDEFMEMVEENHNILKSCKNHEFEELCTKTYVCKNCGGIIDKCNLYWYDLGKEHAKNNLKGEDE